MTQVHELLRIGDDFELGAIGNMEIDCLLGFDAVVCGEFAIRSDDGYTCCPDYCGDESLTRAELEKLNIHPIILPFDDPAAKKRAKRAKLSSLDYEPYCVAVFVVGREIYATRAFKRESEALACALWYSLAYHT